MESVFGFVPDGTVGPIYYLVGYFFAAMGGETVQEYGVWLGLGGQFLIDLVFWQESLEAFFFLFFHAHGDESVCVDGVGGSDGGLRILCEFDFCSCFTGRFLCLFHSLSVWSVGAGRGDGDIDPGFF